MSQKPSVSDGFCIAIKKSDGKKCTYRSTFGQYCGIHKNLNHTKIQAIETNTQQDTHETITSGNIKRIKKCKDVGREKKLSGHKFETDFTHKYNPSHSNDPTEYGATSDTFMTEDHPLTHILHSELNVSHFNCSNKSGNNIQFTLGRIPELDNAEDLTPLTDKTQCYKIFQKYLKKVLSSKPVDLVVYKDTRTNRYIFFNVDHIIDFIVENAIWRKLSSGRIKGDFFDDSSKNKTQYITYEYRESHHSHFLGLNGNKGIKFIDLLLKKIPFIMDVIS